MCRLQLPLLINRWMPKGWSTFGRKASGLGPPRDPYQGMHGAVFKTPETMLLDFSSGPQAKVPKSGAHPKTDGSASFLNALKDREAVSWKAKRDKERAGVVASHFGGCPSAAAA